MKRTYLIIIVGLFVSACSLPAQVSKYKFDWKAVAPSQALAYYAHLSGLALVEDSHVSHILQGIHLRAAVASKSEALKLVDEALIKQAGIVITPLDNKRASVTYNDALPIARGKH